VAWSYGAFASSRALTLITTAILARVLTPEEFGIVGFATVGITYLSVAQDLGLGGALIYERERPDAASHVVFSWNLVLGILLFALGYLTAPLAAQFFDSPEVTSLMRVLSVTFLVAPLGSVHLILLQRDLDFRRKLVPDVGNSLVKGIVSITLALTGFGVWSLVLGHLAGTIVGVGLVWLVVNWRPRLDFNRSLTRSLMAYGLPLFVVDLIYVVTANVDYLVVGRVLGAAALGIYTLAYRLPELLVLGIVAVLSRALFPAFTKARDSPGSLQRGFLDSVRYVVIFTTPLCVGLFIAARPLVLVTLGDNWLDVIPVLRVLAVFAWVRSLMSNDGDVYKALGMPGFLARITALRLFILVPVLIATAQIGLVAVALGHLGTTIVDKGLRIFLISRRLDIAIGVVLRQFVPSVIAAIPLAAMAVIALYMTQTMIPLAQLAIVTLTGAVVYLLTIWFLERDALLRVLRLIRGPALPKDGEGSSAPS
jgi:O-antigen/teichoic acid export membrane protein